MPTNYKTALMDAVKAAFEANSGITAAFKPANRRYEGASDAARERLAVNMPVDRTSLAVTIVGGDEQATRTPHFGLTGTVTVCDAIIPVSVVLRITMRYDKEKLNDQTPPETYVRQALHQGYPKLGLSYVRDFTIREKRTPPAQATNGVTELVWDVTVTMRLHLSQLRD